LRSSLKRWKLQSQIFTDTLNTPIGRLTLWFIEEKKKQSLIRILFNIVLPPDENLIPVRHPFKQSFKNQFIEYLQGKRKVFDIPYVMLGTEFEKKVWETLLTIPYGETRSYQWLANEVGLHRGARAVGQALKRNPLPIIIPCHRIIHEDGSLGGYSSGVDIKRRLLDLEYYYSL